MNSVGPLPQKLLVHLKPSGKAVVDQLLRRIEDMENTAHGLQERVR
jgi:hypothetical protein